MFKSAKLIPTMLVATVVNQQQYDTRDYASASLLVIGAAGFAYDAGKTGDASGGAGYGIALLTVSIFCDALVPNVQQRLMGGSNEVRRVAVVPGAPAPHTPLEVDSLPALSNRRTHHHPPPPPLTTHHHPNHHHHAPRPLLPDHSPPHPTQVSAAQLMVNLNSVGFGFVLAWMIMHGSLAR